MSLAAALDVEPDSLRRDTRIFPDADVDIPRLDVFVVETFIRDLAPGFAFQSLEHIRWATVGDLAYYCGIDLDDLGSTTR